MADLPESGARLKHRVRVPRRGVLVKTTFFSCLGSTVGNRAHLFISLLLVIQKSFGFSACNSADEGAGNSVDQTWSGSDPPGAEGVGEVPSRFQSGGRLPPKIQFLSLCSEAPTPLTLCFPATLLAAMEIWPIPRKRRFGTYPRHGGSILVGPLDCHSSLISKTHGSSLRHFQKSARIGVLEKPGVI